MKKQLNFKPSLLAISIASALTAPAAFAQDAQVEEIVVTGIRGSLERAMDIKRDAKGIVDAISAEDIGKYPDSNLAESLQRISGVSISRRNGEGSQVTIRGFGPEFNMVTLNGRMLPSSALDPNIGGGVNITKRSFDMDNIASEGINGVQVYKTSKANIASGGIGGTINLETLRPLDNAGLKASFGVKALSDQTNRVGSDVTPEASGILSWSDDDQVFGVAVAASFQQRDSGNSGAYTNNWSNNQLNPGQANYPRSIPTTQFTNYPDVVNADGNPQVIGVPTSLRYYHADVERERLNGQATIQFSPSESVTATLDYVYAEQELYQNRAELSAWFQDFNRTHLSFDNAVVPTPVLYWEQSGPNRTARDIGFALQQQNQRNQLNSLGLNVEWQVNDSLNLAFDYADSSSKGSPTKDFGNWINIGLGANIADQQGADWTGDVPVILYSFDDSNNGSTGGVPGALDLQDVGSQVMQTRRESSETDITQMRIDGEWEFSDGSSIDFGVERREMSNRGRLASPTQLLEGGWGVSNPGDIPAGTLSPLDFNGLLDGYSLAPQSAENAAFFANASGGTATPLTVGYIGDAAVIGSALAEAAGVEFSLNNQPDTTNRLVEEDINAAYVQVNVESSLGDMPLSIVAGLRYEETTVTSTSLITLPTVRWDSNDDFVVVSGNGDPTNFSAEASYDHLLPNIDVSLDITDTLKGRMGFSSTIARNGYSNLSTAATINGGNSGGPTLLGQSSPGTASNGNPGLLPLESDNFDLSLEWYFGEASYISAGYFQKRVDNFVGNSPTQQSIYGIRDPSNGPRARAARDELISRGIDVNDSTLFAMTASIETGIDYDSRTLVEWENAVDLVGNEDDPLMIFTSQVPTNVENANIEGFEFGGQHFFGDTGIGVQGNYTIVNGDVSYDVAADPSVTQFALVGLSDTANLSLIYENFGFQGRLTYNWRDDFLNNTALSNNEPEFTEDYQQIDLSLSYEVLEGLSVSFEGLNLTEEDQRKHGRTARQLTQMSVLGARYALGVRYTF